MHYSAPFVPGPTLTLEKHHLALLGVSRRARGTRGFADERLGEVSERVAASFGGEGDGEEAGSESISVPAPRYVTMTRRGTWSTWSLEQSVRRRSETATTATGWSAHAPKDRTTAATSHSRARTARRRFGESPAGPRRAPARSRAATSARVAAGGRGRGDGAADVDLAVDGGERVAEAARVQVVAETVALGVVHVRHPRGRVRDGGPRLAPPRGGGRGGRCGRVSHRGLRGRRDRRALDPSEGDPSARAERRRRRRRRARGYGSERRERRAAHVA